VFRVDLTDAAGNLTSRSVGVAVDRTAALLRWSPALFFPQDGDALAATGSLSFRLARAASTTLVVRDAAGTVVRTAWRSRTRPAGTTSWRWDGRNASGRFVPRGRYTAALTVVGRNGAVVLTRTVIADAFTATASSTRPVAGTTLSVTFRSAETLAGAPTATFLQTGRSPVGMTVTRLAGGAWRASVVVAAGAPGPATVVLAARDAAGHRNTSSLALAVP
jgi:FlgD Ig-like domain